MVVKISSYMDMSCLHYMHMGYNNTFNNFVATFGYQLLWLLLKFKIHENDFQVNICWLFCNIFTIHSPTEWTQANVAPILKKDSKLQAVNYHPVSLTCITCKLFEHIIC